MAYWTGDDILCTQIYHPLYNKNFDKLVEEWKAILDVLMPWHSTLEPAIVSGLKSKEATQNAAKQLRATLTSFSSMYAQQLKPFSDSINTDM